MRLYILSPNCEIDTAIIVHTRLLIRGRCLYIRSAQCLPLVVPFLEER
jgi:hypothetical protein